ncbi:acyl-CoA thioesterase [Actinocorallia aurantiaca]|uniref:Acyl-CoA thioesterase II n=1 Tax=Actinocorallia aurantiaca TaxID=46204 RepID=A0ABP6H8C2_9ACTN
MSLTSTPEQPSPSPELWGDLLSCLELRAPAEEAFAFEGRNQRLKYHRLFGGQLLAQFARAAALTCPEKAVKSLHALFPRAGTSEEPVRYEVERHHEGRAFATLTITARQSKGAIATASVSMHAAENGLDHQTTEPVPSLPDAEHRVDLDLIPWETRTSADLDSPKQETPELELWMRTPQVDEALAPALAAYATDLTLIGTALRPVEGVSQRDSGTAFASAVTSHTLWFHRPFRTDDWLLLRQHSPILAHGRSFGRGDVLTATGTLVASYAQEALLRFQS